LANIPTLLELHIPIEWPSSDLAKLQQIRVLSIFSLGLEEFSNGICRLTKLRQLMIDCYPARKEFDSQIALEIGDNLKHLESLVICNGHYELDYNHVVPILIERLPLLNTLVLECRGRIYRRPKINLNPYRHRPVRLNIFIDDRIRFVFVGSSTQVHIVPVVNYRCGDVVTFLSSCNQNGFDFKSNCTLTAMFKKWMSFSVVVDTNINTNICKL